MRTNIITYLRIDFSTTKDVNFSGQRIKFNTEEGVQGLAI